MQLVHVTVMARFLLASFRRYSFSNAGAPSLPSPTRSMSLQLSLRVPGGTNDRRRSSGFECIVAHFGGPKNQVGGGG